MYDPAKKVPLSIFDAQPVQGKRVMNVSLEQSSESELSLIFHGCTWHFRDKFDEVGVTASRYEEEFSLRPIFKSMFDFFRVSTLYFFSVFLCGDGRIQYDRVIFNLQQQLLRSLKQRTSTRE